jgi:Ca2+-binding RTX toxin-like protein
MYSTTPARPRGRTRRALLAALPAVLATAFALPAPADAARVEVNPFAPVVGFTAAPGETNHVFVTVNSVRNKLVISDNTAPITAGNGCTLDAFGRAECPINVDLVNVQLHDGNDRIEYAAPHEGSVGGEVGSDVFIAGIRQAAPGRAIEPVSYAGGSGADTISYQFADRGVRVDAANNFPNPPNDGRPGIDLESVTNDFEFIEGSNFDDPQLFGSDRNEVIRGLNGNDVIGGGGGDDIIDEGSAPNGADTISGDTGANDRIFYFTRTSGVDVSLGDGRRNDGALGEQDNVGGSVEDIGGTNFRDVLTGGSPANTIDGFGGNDTITGGRGDDTLSTGTGNNGVTAGIGNDLIFARNGEIDNIDCGDNTDTAERDTDENRVVGCERGQVGALRVTPTTVQAKAGDTTRLRLSWRHPQDWRRLRKLELRLTRDGVPVGEVTIRPQSGRISADGAVELVRKRSGLTRKGKTVAARLALRLDESLAGQTLRVEVEATDARGRRQLERGAGTVRVLG